MNRHIAKRIIVFVVGYSSASGTSIIVRKFIKQNVDMTDTSRYQKLLVGIATIYISSFAAKQISDYAKKPINNFFKTYDEYFPETKTEL